VRGCGDERGLWTRLRKWEASARTDWIMRCARAMKEEMTGEDGQGVVSADDNDSLIPSQMKDT
jgi:hypothetical protein